MYPYPAYSLRPVLCRSAPLSVERLRGRQQGEEGHRAQEQGHQEQEHQREGGPGQRKKSEKSYNLRIIAKIFRRAKSCNFLMFAMMYFPRTFTVWTCTTTTRGLPSSTASPERRRGRRTQGGGLGQSEGLIIDSLICKCCIISRWERVGTTSEGRGISVLRIKLNDGNSGRKAVWTDCGIHARHSKAPHKNIV